VQAVYTLFGGKPGLCEALFEEGFAALQTALDAVEASAGPEKDFGEPVVGQALAYRAVALASPGTYAMMFGRRIPEFRPSPAARARARDSFESLVTALRRAPSPIPPTRRRSRQHSSCGL
jgi:AcrR family transcriptional regulator